MLSLERNSSCRVDALLLKKRNEREVFAREADLATHATKHAMIGGNICAHRSRDAS